MPASPCSQTSFFILPSTPPTLNECAASAWSVFSRRATSPGHRPARRPTLLYGDQPYGFTNTGTVESIQAITREQMLTFWSQRYGPQDSALMLSGDIKEKDARLLAEQYLGTWTASAKSPAGEISLPAAPPAPALRLVIVDKPGSPQTALFAFGIGIPRTASNLEAVQVMNYTLGAAFASRINMNLREVHGFTYGAQSSLRALSRRRPLLRRRHGQNRRHRARCQRIDARNQAHPIRPTHRSGDKDGEGRPRPVTARPVRNHRRDRIRHDQYLPLQPSAHLLCDAA